MSESLQYSDLMKDVNGQENTTTFVAEFPNQTANEGLGENKEFGEVKELRYS